MKIKIALAQFSVDCGNIDSNLERIRTFAERASRQHRGGLLCLPELSTTGFNWKLNRELSGRWASTREALSEIARSAGLDLCGSFLEPSEDGRGVNRFLYFDKEGRLVGSYDKIHLFSAFDEQDHIRAGDRPVVGETRLGKIGFSICYDLRFPGTFRRNTISGARIHVLPAAFPKPRLSHWRILLQARAIENQSFVIGVNQCGFEGPGEKPSRTEYFGHSMAVGPTGVILAEAGEGEELLPAELNLAELEEARSVFDSIRDGRPAVD